MLSNWLDLILVVINVRCGTRSFPDMIISKFKLINIAIWSFTRPLLTPLDLEISRANLGYLNYIELQNMNLQLADILNYKVKSMDLHSQTLNVL